jgi:hypothetical protein
MSAVMSDVHRQARSPAARQRLFHLPTPARPALRLIEPKRKIAKKTTFAPLDQVKANDD